jgi:LuxR family maltose regulon positive regulatory protein
MVPRPRLTPRLAPALALPLTLVSAPAGYGKSTMISAWLESVDFPSAWLTLDEQDNDLGDFLRYLVAAVQNIFPNPTPETQALVRAAILPPISVIAKSLINELDRIEQPFILVLDDYQLIESQSIHDLLNELLLHPPRSLRLVLSARMDPPLSLVTLRARGQMVEIRSQDLRFNREETLTLFQKMVGKSVDRAVISQTEARTEGWVSGLRLAALAMRHRIGWDSFQGDVPINNRYVSEYFVSEILTKQAATMADAMLTTSILERFCADLCADIYLHSVELPGSELAGSDFDGSTFLKWLQDSNLFVIPLDDQHEWFRYHHLFRDFLQQELVRRIGLGGIGKLHAAAGRWYARKGWVDEALEHLLAAGEIDAAIRLVEQHRYRMLNNTQWPLLERRLRQFPLEVIENSAVLWMIKIWLVYHHGQWAEIPALVEHLTALVEQGTDPELADSLDGEISVLRSLIAFQAGNAQEAISHARRALRTLPPELWVVRILARTFLGTSLLRVGDLTGGNQAYYGAFEEEKVKHRRFKATILMTACNFHWLTADLQSMSMAAEQSIALCQETEFLQILGHGQYNLGRVRYQWDDLPAAEDLFAEVVSRPYHNYGIPYTNSVCGLAMTYQALGRGAEASKVTEEGIAFLLQTGNTTQLPLVLASQAELALRQGRLPFARQWAEKFDPPPPLAPMYGFLAPHLTLVKVWLAQNTPTSQRKAAKLLDEIVEYLQANHNTRFLIEALALQAMLWEATGERPAALSASERALRLAQTGGFIRLFVDLGPEIEALLSRLRGDKELDGYVERIRSAFPGSRGVVGSMSQDKLPEPLTNRELQVLELLRDRLTNKEIAAQLVISPGTVKGHTIHIYQKLEVKGRRQAVEKANSLGLLPGE